MAPWMRKANLSVRLKNTGSVARDHLANERTFLAWLRTSLAFASIGVAVTQFFRLSLSKMDHNKPEPVLLRRLSTALGSLFVAVALVIMVFGVTRYFSTQYYLQKGQFPVSKITIIMSFFFTLILAGFTLATLIQVTTLTSF